MLPAGEEGTVERPPPGSEMTLSTVGEAVVNPPPGLQPPPSPHDKSGGEEMRTGDEGAVPAADSMSSRSAASVGTHTGEGESMDAGSNVEPKALS